ncbi:MAG: transporter substrate-binding domain-containing protein [Pseudomonadota bacterium]|nr:transporter substrate-binding domain-containing protein [Pseudomonadota bacterium]
MFFALALLFTMPAFAADQKEPVFDRIIRTGMLRCGYYVFPPFIYRDPNTDRLSGFTVDMMEEVGKRAGLKTEWMEEHSWSGWTEALKAGRFDVTCAPMWPDIPASRAVAWSTPMFYSAIFPVVRTDDTRFQGDSLEQFNKKGVTLSAPEGDALVSLTQAWFPEATLHLLPQGTDTGSFGLQLATRKADALLWDDNGVYQFNKSSETKIRPVARSTPVKIQAFSLAVDRNEMVLKAFLDDIIRDLLNDGTMDRLMRKWEPEPGKTWLRVASPYKDSP